MSAVQKSLLALLLVISTATALAQGMSLPPFQRVRLDNGTTLLLNEKHDVPLIGLNAILRGGAVSDPEGLHGLSGLLARLLEKGAGDRDAAAFAEAIDSVGGRLSASGGLETISISGDFLASDADLMVELLADMLRRPALSPAEMQKLRDRSINFIRAAKDSNLDALLPIYGSSVLFADHPYGNPVSGSEASLAAISIADISSYYDNHVGGDRLVLSVSGDFHTETMKQKLSDAFADWRAANAEVVVVDQATPVTGRQVLLVDKPGATQTYFWIGNVGVGIRYAQRAELDIANTVFGGRFTSMLNTELRLKSGLTYGAGSVLTRPLEPGSVAITSFTRTDATVEAIDMALGELTKLRETGISVEMIDSARNYILGQFPTRLETAPQLAGLFATLEAFDLDSSYIDAYGPAIASAEAETITAVIREVYPSPDNLVFVLLGDAALIREAIVKYGPVTELSITEPRFRP